MGRRTAAAELADAVQRLPTWARITIYLGGGVAAASIQFGSSWSLGALALHVGLGWPRLVLLPVALDLGAIVAGVLWVAGHGKMRTTGRWATIGLVLSSMGFNALDALVVHGKISADQQLMISVAIAVVFPLTAALMGHIVLLVRESDSAAVVAQAAAADREQREKVARDRALVDREAEQRLALASQDATVNSQVKLITAEAEAQALVETAKASRLDDRRETGVGSRRPSRSSTIAPAASDGWDAAAAQRSVDGLPGDTKGQKLEAYFEQEWNAGREATAPDEWKLYGPFTKEPTYGRKAIKALKERGVLPPSERLRPLVAVRNGATVEVPTPAAANG